VVESIVSYTTRRVERLTGVVLACAVLVAGACSAADTLNPRTDVPILLVVLSSAEAGPVQPTLNALFATSGRPSTVEYRSAQSFKVRRAVDGATFAWRPSSVQLPSATAATFLPLGGNYTMEQTLGSAGLGRDSLAPSTEYLIEVLHDGPPITGTTRMPKRPDVSLLQDGDGTRLVWRRVEDAHSYFVIADGVDMLRPIADTSVVLPRLRPANGLAHVFALDSNYGEYLQDSTKFSAGVSNAYGVVGSVSIRTVAVPASTASAVVQAFARPMRIGPFTLRVRR